MTPKIIQCPFCGSTNLYVSTHSSGGPNKHYIATVICRKCGCHGPTVKSEKLDWRDFPPQEYMEKLEQQAFDKFAMRSNATTNDNEPFKLEGMQ